MKKRPKIPRLDGGQQTILLVDEVARTAKFYQDVMRLTAQDGDGERYVEFETGDGGTLLIVQREGSIAPLASMAGTESPATLTFSIAADGFGSWKKWMARHGVPIEQETKWIHGGRSLYVLDPDGRRIEFKAPASTRGTSSPIARAETARPPPSAAAVKAGEAVAPAPVEIAPAAAPASSNREKPAKPARETAAAATAGLKGKTAGAPPIHGVVETILYSDDLPKAVAFYRDVLGLLPMTGMSGRFQAFDSGAGRVLLLFGRGSALDPMTTPGGVIPPHDGQGPHHVGLAIDAEDYGTWRTRLRASGVVIESETVWDRGGRSIYFRDPDKHLVELVTPGIWPNY